MEDLSAKSLESEHRRQREMDRCRREIEAAEHQLRTGHPDVAGLCLALADWSMELRILEGREWKNESCNI